MRKGIHMSLVNELKERILAGGEISREEALQLFEEPVEEVARAADEIREKFCGNGFDICTIVNGKSGRCSENCKFCAQSAHYDTGCAEVYDLLPTEDILKEAKYNDDQGVLRYSIVTSGKRLTDEEVDQVCESIRKIKEETNIEVCFSFGSCSRKNSCVKCVKQVRRGHIAIWKRPEGISRKSARRTHMIRKSRR